MVNRIRSPLGELVVGYQRRMGFTQAELAAKAFDTGVAMDMSTVSARTISAIVKQVEDPTTWVSPYRDTANILAVTFGLEPGSPAWQRVVDAAAAPGIVAPDTWLDQPSPTPFIEAGREPHLARLRQHVANLTQQQPGVVFVRGAIGSGKSALIQAICEEAVEATPGLVTLWGRNPEQRDRARPQEPFRQILQWMVGGIGDASEEQRVSNANIGWLAARAPAAARALAEDGAGLIQRTLSDEQRWNPKVTRALEENHRQMIDAARNGDAASLPGISLCDQFFRVLARYAADGPVVLVLEDLHWADTSTLLSLTHLVRQLQEHRLPVLVIGSLRPGEVIPSTDGVQLPALMGEVARRFSHSIVDLSTTIGGAPGGEFVRALLDRSFETVSRQAVDTLFRLTTGLPLLAAGFVDAWLREGDAGVAPSDEATWLTRVPPDIPILIDAQLARLSPAQRRILEAASVQGDTVSAELTMEVLGYDPASWMQLVDNQIMRQHRLLAPDEPTTIDGLAVHRYRFASGLLREHIRGGMREDQLARLHRETAEALIALYGEKDHEASGDIAFHLDQAGETARAATAYVRAGVDAMIRHQHRRAIAHFDRIQQLPVTAVGYATRIQSFIGMGNTMRGLGDVAEARRLLDQARVLAEQRGEPQAMAAALESMAMIDFDMGRMSDGVARLGPAVDTYLDLGARDDAARAIVNLSYLRYGQGRYDDALDLAEDAHALAMKLGNDRTWVDARNARAICLIDLGQPEAAMSIYQHAIEVCDELGDHHRARLCLLNVALAALEQEHWELAHDTISELLDSGSFSTRLVSAAELNAGLIAEGMNDLQAAGMHYERSRRIREDNGQVALLIDSLAGLLRIAVTEDDAVTAEVLRADIGRRIAIRGAEGTEHGGRLFVTLIEAALAAGDVREARSMATMAMAFLRSRADRLDDPANRRRYLDVAANRRVMELDELLDDWQELHPTG